MNLILLENDDFVQKNRVRIGGRRREHILQVHRAAVGDSLRVGLLNGNMGQAILLSCTGESLELEVLLDQAPPKPLDIRLILALPRPKMLKRVLQAVASLGVKQIELINSYRVDKSFWSSPLLQPEPLKEQLCLGLEQARDTRLPQIRLHPRFKPFVEDQLPQLSEGTQAYVAHPTARQSCPQTGQRPVSLAIGPEGGFIPYEVDKLTEIGFAPVSLGERILRVETAVPVLLTRLAPELKGQG